jgi:hypothetical protein
LFWFCFLSGESYLYVILARALFQYLTGHLLSFVPDSPVGPRIVTNIDKKGKDRYFRLNFLLIIVLVVHGIVTRLQIKNLKRLL